VTVLQLVARQPRRTMTGRLSAGVATPTPTSAPARILTLQAQAGNRAVAGLLTVQRDDKTKASRVKFPGLVLGRNRAKQDVKVDHELGSPLGYRGRRQAIGVARMAKAPHAVVVETGDKQWHALATTADFEAGRVTNAANIAGILEVHGMTALGWVDVLKRDADSARDLAASFKALHSPDRDVQKRIDALVAEFEHGAFELDTDRIAAQLGVPPAEVERIATLGSRVADKINITGTPDVKSPGGGHAPMGGSPDFQQGAKSSMWIDLPEFAKTRAPAVMFHESEHMADWEMTQQAIVDYEKAGHVFVQGPSGLAPFQAWLNGQVRKKLLSAADAEIIVDETFNRTATTEARANVRTFLALFASGDTDAAAADLKAYANNLKPTKEGGLGHYAMPAPGSAVRAELAAEAAAMYKPLSAPLRAKYDAAVEGAIVTYKSGWLDELRMKSKRR
jgi:hypothetical protein